MAELTAVVVSVVECLVPDDVNGSVHHGPAPYPSRRLLQLSRVHSRRHDKRQYRRKLGKPRCRFLRLIFINGENVEAAQLGRSTKLLQKLPVGSLSQHLEGDRMRGRREHHIELRELVGRQTDIQGSGILLQPVATSGARNGNHVVMRDEPGQRDLRGVMSFARAKPMSRWS